MSEVSFQKESIKIIFSEGMDLLRKHYHEIAHYQDIAFEPDEELYLKVEQAGCLETFTARKEGKLIGYALFLVKHNLHYKSSKQANQDVIYVDPEQRGFGMKFIKWCDQELKKLGVQAVYHHVKSKHDFGAGLTRMGYELVDLIYAKRLDKGD